MMNRSEIDTEATAQTIQATAPMLEDRLAAEAAEVDAAEALVTAAIAALGRGLVACTRDELVLGLDAIAYRRPPQYAVTSPVSGWSYVLTRAGIVRREYRGDYSDFPDYHHVTYRDTPASARQVVTDSQYDETPSWRAHRALRVITERASKVAATAQTRAARERVERLRAAVAALAK